MSNPNNPWATKPNPVTQALDAFGSLSPEQRIVALAACLLEAEVISSQTLMLSVSRVSGRTTA